MLRLIFYILIVGIVSCFSVQEVFASQYSIPHIQTEIEIRADGVVVIHDRLTYRFDRSFSWAEYDVPKRGFSSIRAVQVLEQTNPYLLDNSEQPGTYQLFDRENKLTVKWHYRSVDTTRTFTIRYELEGALSVGPEYSELFWNVLGAGRDRSTDSLHVALRLPDTAAPDDLSFWPYIQTGTHEAVKTGDLISLRAYDLQRRHAAGIRLLFPTHLLDSQQVAVTDPQLNRNAIVAEETRRIDEAREAQERQAFYRSILDEVIAVLLALSLFSYLFFYNRYGKRHSTGMVSDRETVVIPDRQTPPALVNMLLQSGVSTSREILATAFDLTRRGWFVLEEKLPPEAEESRTGWSMFSAKPKPELYISLPAQQPDESLLSYEQQIEQYLRAQLSDGGKPFTKVFDATAKGYTTWHVAFTKALRSDFKAMEWIDQRSKTGAGLSAVVQGLLLTIAIVILFLAGTASGISIIGVVIIGILTIASAAIIRHTPSGAETIKRWRAYRKGLRSTHKNRLQLGTSDLHFIYAVLFGLNEKKLLVLIEALRENGDQTALSWIIISSASQGHASAVAKAISSVTASAATSFSGTGGAVTGSAGGGASARAG
ncbi:MAG: DUF2207 domain-containing protein [Balneolaceae bacterium]